MSFMKECKIKKMLYLLMYVLMFSKNSKQCSDAENLCHQLPREGIFLSNSH